MALPLRVRDVNTLSLVVLLITASSCAGRTFNVGFGYSWNWAIYAAAPPDGHLQINETLSFMTRDTVLRVRQGNYDTCNTAEPILRLGIYPRFVVLDKPGYYYFISSDAERCHNGERIITVAIDNNRTKRDDINTPSPLLIPHPPPKSAPPPSPLQPAPSLPAPAPSPTPHALPSPPKSEAPAPSSVSSPLSTPPPAPSSPSNKGNVPSPAPAIQSSPSTVNVSSPPPLTASVPGTNEIRAPSMSSAVVLTTGGALAALFFVVGATLIIP